MFNCPRDDDLVGISRDLPGRVELMKERAALGYSVDKSWSYTHRSVTQV